MAISKRERLLNLIAANFAEGNDQAAIRLYIENRISYSAFNDARRRGLAIKAKLAAQESIRG